MQLPQRVQAAAAGQQQVEDHEVVVARQRPREALLAVRDHVDAEALGLERAGEEGANPRLILNNQYSHLLFRAPTARATILPSR